MKILSIIDRIAHSSTMGIDLELSINALRRLCSDKPPSAFLQSQGNDGWSEAFKVSQERDALIQERDALIAEKQSAEKRNAELEQRVIELGQSKQRHIKSKHLSAPKLASDAETIKTLTEEKYALQKQLEALKFELQVSKKLKEPKPTTPQETTAEQVESNRRTNFHDIAGELVLAARLGGMKPRAITLTLQRLLRQFNGTSVTDNMIYGVRMTGDPNDILPANDASPLTRAEVMAMATSLWGDESNIEPMERFFITHAQTDISEFMTKDRLEEIDPEVCKRIRKRYHLEMSLRGKNERYAKFSRGLARLPKRIKVQTEDKAVKLLGRDIADRAREWFRSDEDDVFEYLAQLCGWSKHYIKDIVDGKRDLSKEMEEVILRIDSLIEGLDVDSEEFVGKLFRRVGRKNSRTPQGTID